MKQISDIVTEFFTYFDDYANKRYHGQEETDKRYLKIGVAIMLGHMLRKEMDNAQYLGYKITKEAVRYFPTGFKSLDQKLNKDYFTDRYLHDFLIQDPGNYKNKQLVLESDRGLLTNMAIIYWYWRKSTNFKAFKELRKQ